MTLTPLFNFCSLIQWDFYYVYMLVEETCTFGELNSKSNR